MPWRSDSDARLRAAAAAGVAIPTTWSVRVGSQTVTPTALSVAFDARRSPRATARLTTRDRISADPRRHTPVLIRAGYVHDDVGTDEDDLASLMLHDVRRDALAASTELGAVGLEHHPMTQPAQAGMAGGEGYSWRGVLQNLLRTTRWLPVVATIGAQPLDQDPIPDRDTPSAALVREGEDVWGAAVRIAEGFGAELYHDAAGRWVAAPPAQLAAPSLEVSAGDRLTTSMVTTSTRSGEWYNVVDLEYVSEATLSNGGTVTLTNAQREVATGAYAPAVAGTRELRIRGRDVFAQANAEPILARRLAAGRTITVRTRARWWLRPGDTVRVSTGEDPSLNLLCVGVDFDLIGGWMTLDLATATELT